MSLSRYAPLVTALSLTLGIALFGTVVYAQNGGFVSDVSQPVRQGITILEQPTLVPVVQVEQLPIELDEVTVTPRRQTHKTWIAKKHKKIWHCKSHELAQGGLVEAPTVDVCEWVPFNP
jgi:hypothetical protein